MESAKQNITHNFLDIGTLLKGGRYRIEKYIASGGFGNTYKVYDKEKSKISVIKEFFINGDNHREINSNNVSISNPMKAMFFENMKYKFKKEASRLISLNDPNIIKVYDLFEENQTVYYVMNFIDGYSLNEMVKKLNRPFSEMECYHILSQLLKALEVIHNNGLIHMDIKPGNILIDKSGNCTLIDFGASKQTEMDGITSTSSVVCYTQGYAPPEQISGNKKQWGPWTDFFALGATLYSIVSGKNPPTHDQLLTYGYDILKFPISVSRKFQNLIKWMMNLAFNKRPQNVKQIQSFLSNENKQTIIGLNQPSVKSKVFDRSTNLKDYFDNIYNKVKNLKKRNKNKDFRDRLIVALIVTIPYTFIILVILSNFFDKKDWNMASVIIGIPLAISIFILIFKSSKDK